MEAAIRRFLRQGFKKTSIGEIAADVGLVKSALYRHFNSKDNLFAAVVEHVSATYWEGAESRSFQGDTPVERLGALLAYSFDHFTGFAQRYQFVPTVWRELRPMHQVLAAPYKVKLIKSLDAIITEGVQAGLFQCEAPFVLASLMQLATETTIERVILRQISLEEGRRDLRVIVNTLITGLLKRSI